MTNRTRRTFITAGALATFGSVAGCFSNNKVDGSSLPFTRCRTDITYTVVDGKDLSSRTGFFDGNEIVRYSRSLTTTPPVSQLSNTDFEEVSKCFLLNFLDYGRKKVNAVRILYITSNATPNSTPCATVEWAPNGDFGQASEVDTANYIGFELSISTNPTYRPEGETTSS